MSLDVTGFGLDWSDPDHIAVTLFGVDDTAAAHVRFERQMAEGFAALLQAAARTGERHEPTAAGES